jgi:hypothetical protein
MVKHPYWVKEVLFTTNLLLTLTRPTLPWKQEAHLEQSFCTRYQKAVIKPGPPSLGTEVAQFGAGGSVEALPVHNYLKESNQPTRNSASTVED